MTAESQTVNLDHAAASDVGMRRANNQDSFAVVVANSPERFSRVGHLFVVADGMGAHAAGELASRIAAEKIPHYYLRSDGPSAGESLQRAVISANNDIHRRGQENPEFHNMGTTASSLALLPEGALIAHVGDSRVYRLRGENFEQLTFDHSLVWEMQAAGQVRPGSELSEAIPKNVITRSLGPNAEVTVDLEGPLPIQPGDTFLLCSDGLSGQVTDEELGALLSVLEPKVAVKVFIDLANLRGGPDNITVVVAKVLNGSGNVSVAKPVQRGELSLPLLVVGGTAIAASGVFILVGQTALAAVFFVLAMVIFAAALMQYLQPKRQGQKELPKPTHRTTSSPYRRYSARARPEMVQHLASTIAQIRKASEQKRWRMDWTKVNEWEQQAHQAVKYGKMAEALRCEAHAVNETMIQLRDQQNRAMSDTTIEY